MEEGNSWLCLTTRRTSWWADRSKNRETRQ